MTRLEVLSDCWGAPPKEYPEDLPRCNYCYDGTCGSVFIHVPAEIYSAVMFGEMTVDQLIKEGYLSSSPPPCEKTGAKRIHTSTTLG
ncbi:hypothetical protein IPM65_03215 [Candidatus Roizmanbacteria bacterium]|nr:MAG: hypothetical protein IPM65_03215 [Candidatus Roizmanbacteria bacterium]